MWRKALAGMVVATVGSSAALCLGGCGGQNGSAGRSSGSTSKGGSARGPQALIVHPGSGRTTTAFTFAFSAPDAAGRRGTTQLGYELGVLGPGHPGCVSSRTAAALARTAGVRVTVTLDPAATGGRWCPGIYHAGVTETASPVCASGMMCAQFIRVVRTVATGTFRVLAP